MKPTQAQYTILHAVLSAAIATIIGASTAATQYYFDHGQNLWLALAFFGGSAPALFVTLRYAVWHAIQTNAALPQAERDTANEAKNLAQKALEHIENMWPFLHALNSTQLAAQKVATPVTINPTSTATIPQSSMVVQPSSVPQVPGSTYQQPPLTNTSMTVTLPPRSWNDSALMPAMPALPQPPKG